MEDQRDPLLIPDLPPRRPGTPAARELQALRSMIAAALDPSPSGAAEDELTLGQVPCVICEVADPQATLLWFHGGGFRLGSARQSKAFGERLARATAARVVLVDYALAPERPFPAALHDAFAAFKGARARWPGAFILGGDSAGGGLATALTVAMEGAGSESSGGVVLLSPWCDLTVSAPSYTVNASTDPLFSAASATEAAALYLQGWDAHDPLVSPVLARITRFPSTLIFASTDEVLLDDSRRLTDVLVRASTDVTAHYVPGVQHVWPTLQQDHPASFTALSEISQFVTRCSRAVQPEQNRTV